MESEFGNKRVIDNQQQNKSLTRAIVRICVFRCSIYYVTNYSIDEQGAQRNITINGLFHKMVKLGCLLLRNNAIINFN